jgi:hypothetical protein
MKVGDRVRMRGDDKTEYIITSSICLKGVPYKYLMITRDGLSSGLYREPLLILVPQLPINIKTI